MEEWEGVEMRSWEWEWEFEGVESITLKLKSLDLLLFCN